MHPFDELVKRSDDEIRLAEAALLLATDHCASLDIAPWLARLDVLGRRVERLGASTPTERIAALQIVLVDEERFRGNSDDYYDPRNSLLNEVLDRRLGIPITLSTIWLDVARQLDWSFDGVGLPGHYIIKYREDGADVLVDPFGGGRIVNRAECERLVSQLYGEPVTLNDQSFTATSTRMTLTRMLNNLYSIYAGQEAWRNAMSAASRLVALHPDSPEVARQFEHARRNLVKMN